METTKKRKNDEWVVVAQYALDTDADMAVSLLRAEQVPAVRFPVNGLVASYWSLMEPIRVLVPPDRVEEARELLGDEE